MSAIRFTHIDHCSVLITDVSKARAFYGGVLGLREIAPPKEFDFVAVWYDLGGTYLHLLLKPQPDTISPRHFCLAVTDAAAARRELAAKGVAIDETVKIDAADRFFVRDPDGNRIEILQWLRPYQPDADGRFSGEGR
jgi:catechol 2,3-dioxygenase-like lactoylglutathione lyase family enzyme